MYLLPVIKSYICGIISVCMFRGKLPKYLTFMSVMEVSGKTSKLQCLVKTDMLTYIFTRLKQQVPNFTILVYHVQFSMS